MVGGIGGQTVKVRELPPKTRISVAMTTYNGEKYLREQLDSILMQLAPEDEIVISDDGSEDGTVSILQEYGVRDHRIRLLQGPGLGIKKNVEHALRHCQGAYIFLADQDDIWMPDKVEQVMRQFEVTGATLVIHDAIVFEGDRENTVMDSFFRFRQARAGLFKNILKNSYIGCCMAFRSGVLTKALPIPDQIEMHDQWIGIMNDLYFTKSSFYPQSLIFYRRHGENNSAMQHYGWKRMIRNRAVLLVRLAGRIWRIC